MISEELVPTDDFAFTFCAGDAVLLYRNYELDIALQSR